VAIVSPVVASNRLVLLASVIEAADSGNVNEIWGSVSGCGDFDFGDGFSWQRPRRLELGVRAES